MPSVQSKEDNPDAKILMAGHSLGGLIAEVMAYWCKTKERDLDVSMCVFNSLGGATALEIMKHKDGENKQIDYELASTINNLLSYLF